jgi:hypothetical protein
VELDPSVLDAMRREQAKIDGPARIPVGAAPVVVNSIHKQHQARQDAQRDLRDAMSLWAGWQQSRGLDQAAIQRTFYYRYGRDVMSAQILGATDASTLAAEIAGDLRENNVEAAT